MKKGFYTLTAILGLGMLVSCAGQQGPLSPSTTLVGQSNSKDTNKPVVYTYSTPSSSTLTDAAVFEFHNKSSVPMDMDPSSINSSTIQVFSMTSATTETQLTGLSISYSTTLKRVSITPSGGWTDNTTYRILFTIGIKTAAGAPLDGNGNEIAESSAFDNKNVQLTIGAGSGSYTFTGCYLTSAVLVDAAAGSFNMMTDDMNSIQTGGNITITLTFNEDVDASTVFVNATTLHSNFKFVNDATNAAVAPSNINMAASNVIEGTFTLQADTRYKLTVMGGINGIRSTADAAANLMRSRYFTKTSGSLPEAADKIETYLSTAHSDTSAAVPPTASASYSSTNRCWTISYTSFTGAMNAGTIANKANYKLEALYSGDYYNVEIKALEYVSPTQVLLYVPDSFYPNGSYVTMNVIVSRNVQSSDGVYLDGDGDGVGGTRYDDFRSTVDADVDSQP